MGVPKQPGFHGTKAPLQALKGADGRSISAPARRPVALKKGGGLIWGVSTTEMIDSIRKLLQSP